MVAIVVAGVALALSVLALALHVAQGGDLERVHRMAIERDEILTKLAKTLGCEIDALEETVNRLEAP
jgi:hypothetical protein